ncbi:cytochrome P450 3A41-like [Schistocerca gregaria]|uniref:cytochrome P450 3A41-like n=1 Tax=Schistocerca gregaria TaxID=7010 RepID=UPI00211E9E48|nr:cytochrome P450 3A41-like [Schistocerca gregaria]
MVDFVTAFCVLAALAAVALAAVYRYLTSTFDYFEKRGIVGPKPQPLFGNYYKLWNKVFGAEDVKNVHQYGKVFGTFDGRTPNLIVADADLAKAVLDKERDHFRSRRAASVKNPLVQKSLSILAGEVKGSPDVVVALSREKLRKLTPRILKSLEFLTQNLKKSIEASEPSIDITYAVRNFLAHSLALTLLDKDSQAEEPKVDQNALSGTLEQVLKIDNPTYPVASFPFVLPAFYSQDCFVLRNSAARYLIPLIHNTVKEKISAEKSTDEKRVPDLVDLLLETVSEQKQTTKDEGKEVESAAAVNEEAIVAQSLAVLLNTAQATKSTIALSVATLASKPEIQDKLHSELNKQLQTSTEISFETVQNAQYLDMFLNEMLRLYPSEYRIEHECLENTEFENLKIEKGTIVSIPVYALHHLEDYYPEPHTFNPDRFSPAIAEKRHPYTYLPFGLAGSNTANVSVQYGVLVAKLAVATLIKNFKFVPAEETQIPPPLEEGITGVMKPKPVKISVELRK